MSPSEREFPPSLLRALACGAEGGFYLGPKALAVQLQAQAARHPL